MQIHDRTLYPNLEILRGFAALMVCIGHAYIVLPYYGISKFMSQSILFVANGDLAVTFFSY